MRDSGYTIDGFISHMAHCEVRRQVCFFFFLQTGRAQCDLYVVPPRESGHKSELWLLLGAAYGLVNANAKWQVQSDTIFKLLRLKCLHEILQLLI